MAAPRKYRSRASEERFEERAAILEYEGEMTRQQAEYVAWCMVYGEKDLIEEFFEERAAVFEYEGGMSRRDAERAAKRLVKNLGNQTLSTSLR